MSAPLHGAADLAAYPAGPGGAILHDRTSGQRIAVSHVTAQLVIGAAHSADPSAALAAAIEDAGQWRAEAEHEIAGLRAAGVLPDLGAVRDALTRSAQRERDRADRTDGIGAVGILACERPDSLAQLLESLEPMLAELPSRPLALVSDDSRSPGAAARVSEAVAASAPAARGETVVVDRQSRAEFARRLSAESGIDPTVAEWALLGDDLTGLPSIGANRNTVLLRTRGTRVAMIDDDVSLRVFAPPEEETGGRFQSEGDPFERWFAPTRADVDRLLRPVADNPLRRLAEPLGLHPANLLEPDADPADIDLRAASAAWRRELVTGNERIAVSALGSAGDLGWDNEHYALFQEGATRGRLLASSETFGSAVTARVGAQAVTRPTAFKDLGFLLGACMGLDNDGWLPPFPPIGRAEDSSFGKLLRRCDPTAAGALLPRAVRHDAGPRATAPPSPFAFGFNAWLGPVIGDPGPLLAVEADDRLARLGDHLCDVARMPQPQFQEMVTAHQLGSLAQLTTTLQQRATGAPAFYVEECERFLEGARREALRPLDDLCNVAGGVPALQSQLGRFGRLLRAWPALLDAAERITVEGPLAEAEGIS